MHKQRQQFNRRYLFWLIAIELCTIVPVALLLSFNVLPQIVAGCVGLGVFAGGLSAAMTSAYRLGVEHGNSPANDAQSQ